mgnify:CR=1 FL=1
MKELLEQITKHFKSTETVLGLGVIFILVLIIVPLPGVLLDVLICVMPSSTPRATCQSSPWENV